MIAEKTNLAPIINQLEGWCTLEKAQRLYDLVIESDSQITCELGVFGGKSLIPMGLAHRDKGSGFVFGIDTWHKKASLQGTNSELNNEWWSKIDFEYIYNTVAKAIDYHELNDYCGTIRLNSQTVGLMTADNILDIIHQDSNHSSEAIIAELNLWIPKLKVGGYWIADDTDWTESKEGYSRLSDFGLYMVEDFTKWQIWKKIK